MGTASASTTTDRRLLLAALIFCAASLVHFVHNAEFLADYPNLPPSWTRADVYLAWVALTLVGGVGWFLETRRYRFAGLVVLAAYAMFGLDSLGHYVLAPLSRHTLGMNVTILLEVTTAGLLLVEILRQFAHRIRGRAASHGLERR
jgi:hypothetical protein